jgi:hypothetical protein
VLRDTHESWFPKFMAGWRIRWPIEPIFPHGRV